MFLPLACTLFASALAQGPETSPPSDVPQLCAAFSPFDLGGDGRGEIERLEPLASAGTEGPTVLVLVESRLLEPLPDAPALAPLVERWVRDIAAEGRTAHAIGASLVSADEHRDGQYVLALREFLRAVDAEHDLEGVVLLGRFPDAFIVRTCSWRRAGDVTLRKGAPDAATHKGVRYVRRVPEDVAHRADIVLADLDGEWEDVYVEERTRLTTTTAVFAGAIPRNGGRCVDAATGGVVFEDFFHVSDGKLELRRTLDGDEEGWAVFLDDRAGDHEVAAVDRERPNVIARPDIFVSRLDARGVALSPRTDVVGVDGEGLIDDEGEPREVAFANEQAMPKWNDVWSFDPVLERRLLADALDRNHAYRTGRANVAWRASSIAHDLGSGIGVMRRAAADWDDAGAQADVKGKPRLERFVDWVGEPAILRTVRAHSAPWGSMFGRPKMDALHDAVGGPAWSWSKRGATLVPSLNASSSGGRLDWYLLRTVWANGVPGDSPAFYHHTGCHGISPPGAKSFAYDHPSYGLRQGAESLLFFGNGLALVGRAKVFYDEPRGFTDELAAGGTFGAAWARYFDEESRAETWSKAGGDIGRKRSYFWSVLGDASLRLQRFEARRD